LYIRITAQLPQHEGIKFVQSLRKYEIEENKRKFQWCSKSERNTTEWRINRHINASTFLELPTVFRRTLGRLKCLGDSSLKVLYQTGINLLKGHYEI